MKNLLTSLVLLPCLFSNIFADFTIILRDKSTINVENKEIVFNVRTEHGTLDIPITKIISVELAPRLSMEEKVVAKQKITELWNNNFKIRDAAQKDLSLFKERLFWFLKDFAIEDAEGQKRSEKLLESYLDQKPSKHDRIVCSIGNFQGEVLNDFIECKNSLLGQLKIFLKDIYKVNSGKSFNLDSSRYSTDKGWLNSGFEVRKGNILNIAVSGEIDIFPQTPRKYVCNADKLIVAETQFIPTSMGFPFVKIGENGPNVRLMSQNEFTVTDDGILYFCVGANTWNANNQGVYNIEIISKN